MPHHCSIPHTNFGQAGSHTQHRAGATTQQDGTEDRALGTMSQATQQTSAGLLTPPGYTEGVWHRTCPFCFTPRDGLKDLGLELPELTLLSQHFCVGEKL